MGIGNSSAAAAIMSRICQLPIEQCVGAGTGLNAAGLAHKVSTLDLALFRAPDVKDPLDVLAHFGGFELAMMCGAMLRAAERRMVLLIDGFCATSALLVAHAVAPAITDYCIFSHLSAEPGHRLACERLQGTPLLHLNMRLGEGTGAALIVPLLRSAVAIVRDMATFSSANVATGLHQ
jgi:nicotinate-nucleotide--dimethylbenzimidazole phosphoribosyltransferase